MPIKSAFIANFIRQTRWQSILSESLGLCTTNEKANNILDLSFLAQCCFELATNFKVVKAGEKCHFLFVEQLPNNVGKYR